MEAKWARLQGLMLGIAIMHAVQPIAAVLGDIEWIPKHWVAVAGGIIYTTSFVASMFRQKWGLWINIIGPCVGLTSVLGGFALNQAGVLDLTIRPDTFQIMGGILQVWALILSVQLLKKSS